MGCTSTIKIAHIKKEWLYLDPPHLVDLAFGDALYHLTPVGRLLRRVDRLTIFRRRG